MRFISIILASLIVLSACTSLPNYREARFEGSYGYSQQAIESDRFRVTFTGNSATELEMVEHFLLYRAAELTLEQGFDHFLVVTRDTETEIQTRRRLDGFYRSPYGFHHRYWHPRYGWYHWYDPFWDDFNVEQIAMHEAQAEIVLRRGPAPDTVNAYDAREVIANLADVVRPEA